jgi:hypothetical protein
MGNVSTFVQAIPVIIVVAPIQIIAPPSHPPQTYAKYASK